MGTVIVQGSPASDLTEQSLLPLLPAGCTYTITPRGSDAILEFTQDLDTDMQYKLMDASRATSNEQTIRANALAALQANLNDIATNENWLNQFAATNPTAAQQLAAVKELVRQSIRQAKEINALVRLVLQNYDATT